MDNTTPLNVRRLIILFDKLFEFTGAIPDTDLRLIQEATGLPFATIRTRSRTYADRLRRLRLPPSPDDLTPPKSAMQYPDPGGDPWTLRDAHAAADDATP